MLTSIDFVRTARFLRLAGPERVTVLEQKYPEHAELVQALATRDPTGGKQQYLDWALRTAIRFAQASNAEVIADRVMAAVADFHRLRKYIGSDKYGLGHLKRDINTYTTLDDLRRVVVEATEATRGQVRLDEARARYPKYRAAIREFERANPTGDHHYLDWAVRQVAEADERGVFENTDPKEFVDRVATAYSKHHALSNVLSEIRAHKRPPDLTADLDKFELFNSANAELLQSEGESDVVFEDDDWLVYDIKNKIASCHLGKGRWCVSDWATSHWEGYVADSSEDAWRALMFKSKHDNDDFLIWVDEGDIVEAKDWNNTTRALGDFPNYILPKLGINSEVSDEDAYVDIYFIAFLGDGTPVVHAESINALYDIAASDEYLRGDGYEIYSARVHHDELDALATADLLDVEHQETVEPEYETEYMVTRYTEGDTYAHNLESGDVYEWFSSEDRMTDWVDENIPMWWHKGFAAWSVELPLGKRGESESYWFDQIADRTLLAEREPLGAPAVLFDNLDGVEFDVWVARKLGSNPELLTTYTDKASAQLLAREYQMQGYKPYLRHSSGEVRTWPQHGPAEQPQLPLPGFATQTPRQTSEGVTVGDIIVNDVAGTVSQVGSDQAQAGGLEEAQRIRQEQGRPNAPIWSFDPEVQTYTKLADLRKRALSPVGEKNLKRWLGRDDVQFAIISGALSQTRSKDIKSTSHLRQLLEDAGYSGDSVRRLRGQWFDERTSSEKAEPSYLVLGIDFSDAIRLGRIMGQAAIIYKDRSGNIGMYWLDANTPRVTIPTSADGSPLFGEESTDVKLRKPKPKRRGPPAPEDLWSKSRDLSFSIKYDFDNPLDVPWSGDAESLVTRREVEQHTQAKTPKAAQRQLDEAPYDERIDDPEDPYDWIEKPPVDLEKVPEGREYGFERGVIEPDGGYANIMRVMRLATPEEVDYWQNWYSTAHREAQELANAHGLELEIAAAVIAVLSPGVLWEENVDLAEQVILREDELRAKIAEMQDPATGKWLPSDQRPGFGIAAKHPEFVAKALRILEARDPMLGQPQGVKGPKVEIFFRSMVSPHSTSRDIVLDGHAINIWRGDTKQGLDGIRIRDAERDTMIEDYRRVGDELGLTPQAVQATTWSLWRQMKVEPTRPSTRMNLMGQLMDNTIDPSVLQTLADLNGLSLEELMAAAAEDDFEKEANLPGWLATGLAGATALSGIMSGYERVTDEADRIRQQMQQQQPQQVQEVGEAPKPKLPKNVRADIKQLVTDAATQHGVPSDLAHAVAYTESRYRADAVSHAGAQGVMQLMPATARGLGVKDAMDPEQNIDGGVRYLKQMLSEFDGDTELAVRAYNAGPHNVKKYFIPNGREWPSWYRGRTENNAYAARVLSMSKGGSRHLVAGRIRYEDETLDRGELDLNEVRVGDRVRFDADFDKPGWPRVDAGTVGAVTAVSPNTGVLEVEALSVTAADNGDTEVGMRKIHANPADVVALLHSRDDRIADYQLARAACRELGLSDTDAHAVLTMS